MEDKKKSSRLTIRRVRLTMLKELNQTLESFRKELRPIHPDNHDDIVHNYRWCLSHQY